MCRTLVYKDKSSSVLDFFVVCGRIVVNQKFESMKLYVLGLLGMLSLVSIRAQRISGIVSENGNSVELLCEGTNYVVIDYKHHVQKMLDETALRFDYNFLADSVFGTTHAHYVVEIMVYRIVCDPLDSISVDSIIPVLIRNKLEFATLRETMFLIKDWQGHKKTTAVSRNYFCLDMLQSYGVFVAEKPKELFFGFHYGNNGIDSAIATSFFFNDNRILVVEKR